MARPNAPTGASINATARRLFAPIAPNYDRWSAVLSLGQDPRWRGEMVRRLELPPAARVLDVAAGTGLIARLLESRGHAVIALDLSVEMLEAAPERGADVVLAAAEALPFGDSSFNGLTFSYLLRYVDDPLQTLRELSRVIRPGGVIGMVEFGRPGGAWRPLWWLYTRLCLPVAGLIAGRGWTRVGRFLGPSIDRFHRRYPGDEISELWRRAGLIDIRVFRRSLGGGLIVCARRP
jgi:demethylmenaquinone methyltransferase/2-methoxy-6-polyprenyl-1,4-benzoquinol methylase